MLFTVGPEQQHLSWGGMSLSTWPHQHTHAFLVHSLQADKQWWRIKTLSGCNPGLLNGRKSILHNMYLAE